MLRPEKVRPYIVYMTEMAIHRAPDLLLKGGKEPVDFWQVGNNNDGHTPYIQINTTPAFETDKSQLDDTHLDCDCTTKVSITVRNTLEF